MTDEASGISARFHLAFPVTDLEATRAFYHGLLGCRLGRESHRWIDFDLHGHQITAHRVDAFGGAATNPVDGDAVPVPHFGLILGWDDWQALARRLEESGVEFVIAPKIRFRGEVGEQATMFLTDPSGNALEFKAFRDESGIFTTAEGDES
jgi:extradiol dioxygenase family protein